MSKMKNMKLTSKLQLLGLLMVFILPILLGSLTTPIQAYSSSAGVEEGDTVIVEYIGTIDGGPRDGEVFDRTPPGETRSFLMKPGQLIDGFYQGMLGMKIGERKKITVPPQQGYTDPSHDLYGETLVFDVFLQDVRGVGDDSDDDSTSSFGSTLLTVLGWIVGTAIVGFLGVTGYYSIQKNTTPKCAHCKGEGRGDRLSEGKCGKCGNYYCRQSFSRGCPNCKSNSFVPNDR